MMLPVCPFSADIAIMLALLQDKLVCNISRHARQLAMGNVHNIFHRLLGGTKGPEYTNCGDGNALIPITVCWVLASPPSWYKYSVCLNEGDHVLGAWWWCWCRRWWGNWPMAIQSEEGRHAAFYEHLRTSSHPTDSLDGQRTPDGRFFLPCVLLMFVLWHDGVVFISVWR
jgi:hypothetical protein